MIEQGDRGQTIPLEQLFDRLRRAGIPLGLSELIAAQEALQAGFGLRSLLDLRRMCLALWIKTPEDRRIFDYVFMELFPMAREVQSATGQGAAVPAADGVGRKAGEQLANQGGDETGQIGDEDRSADYREVDPTATGGQSRTRTTGDALPPLPAIEAGRLSWSQVSFEDDISTADDAALAYQFNLLREYQPLTPRQMKQSWRFLRRMHRFGRPVEFDAQGTANQIARDGVFLNPVLRPPRRNVAELTILVDWGGSMVPFHSFANRLVETAISGGRLAETNRFYFYNRLNPTHVLARDRFFVDSVPVRKWYQTLSERDAILIVSDGGAARRRLNTERAIETWIFLSGLKQKLRHIAWLNPMPASRWKGSTAGFFADMVPMFPADRQGLENAIKVLRGRRVARSSQERAS